MQSNKIHNVVLMSEFYSALMLALHVSDCIGPSSGAFCTSCIADLVCYIVPAGRVEQYTYYHIPNLEIQLVQNAPDDGPLQSETCRAKLKC